MRKHLAEGRQDRLQALIRQLIDLQPLHENSVAAQTVATQGEKFAREKVRNARHPRMTGLACDHIVKVWIDAQVSAGVVDYQVQPRVAQRMIVDMFEVTR